MISLELFFAFSVLALAALLLQPVSRLVCTLSVRRLQRRLGRQLDAQELNGQRRRAWILALALCLLFSVLFNANSVDWLQSG